MSASLCCKAEDPVYLDDVACALINGFPATRGPNENQEGYEARFGVLLDDELRNTLDRRQQN